MSENTTIFCSILGIGSHAINVLQELPLEKAGLSDVIFLGVGDSQSPSSDNFEFLKYDGTEQTSSQISGAAEVFFYRSPLALCCVDLDTEMGIDLLGRISPILKNMARPKLFVLFHQHEVLSEAACEAVTALKKLHDNIVIFSGTDCESQVVDYALLALLSHQLCHLQRQGDSGYVETLISSGIRCRTIGHYGDDFVNLPQVMERHGEMQLSSNESIIFFWLIGEDFNEEEHQTQLEEALIRKGWQLDRCFIEIIHMKDWRDSFLLSEIAVSLFKQNQAKRSPSSLVSIPLKSVAPAENQNLLNFDSNNEAESPVSPENKTEEGVSEEPVLLNVGQAEQAQEPISEETVLPEESLSPTEELTTPELIPSDEKDEKKSTATIPPPTTEPAIEITRPKRSHDATLGLDMSVLEEEEDEPQQPKRMWKGLTHFFQNISKYKTRKETEISRSQKSKKSPLPQQELGLIEYSRGIFESEGAPINSWKGEDLDVPTYLRQNITLYVESEEQAK